MKQRQTWYLEISGNFQSEPYRKDFLERAGSVGGGKGRHKQRRGCESPQRCLKEKWGKAGGLARKLNLAVDTGHDVMEGKKQIPGLEMQVWGGRAG